MWSAQELKQQASQVSPHRLLGIFNEVLNGRAFEKVSKPRRGLLHSFQMLLSYGALPFLLPPLAGSFFLPMQSPATLISQCTPVLVHGAVTTGKCSSEKVQ